jgi:hypothetical protein
MASAWPNLGVRKSSRRAEIVLAVVQNGFERVAQQRQATEQQNACTSLYSGQIFREVICYEGNGSAKQKANRANRSDHHSPNDLLLVSRIVSVEELVFLDLLFCSAAVRCRSTRASEPTKNWTAANAKVNASAASASKSDLYIVSPCIPTVATVREGRGITGA